MNNFRTLMYKQKFNPQRLSGLKLWLSASDFSTLTLSYNSIAETGSGTIGTYTITASATVAAKIFAGNKVKIGSTDIYTVASVSTVTITTVETLTATYSALSALAVGQVSQWNDKSGQGNHATQGTGTAQPTFAASILNSKSVLTFDGGDMLILPSALYSIPNGSSTIFAVAKCTDASMQRHIIRYTNGATGRAKLTFGTSAGGGSATAIAFGNGSGVTGVQASGTSTNFQILTGYRSGTTESVQINNGTATSDTNAINAADVDGAAVGASTGGVSPLIGSIAEIILYNRALSTSEILQTSRYLANKWAITIS